MNEANRIFLSFGKKLLWIAFVGCLVDGEKCGKKWKLTAAMAIELQK